MRIQRTFVLALLSVFSFVGCGGRVGDPAALSLAPSPVSLEPGEALGFQASGSAAKASSPQALRWSVQESGGGTVDEAGNYMTPVAEGSFHVLASSSSN